MNQLSITVIKKRSDERTASLPESSSKDSAILALSLCMSATDRLLPVPLVTSTVCRYIRVTICLSRGFFILDVRTRWETPVLARAWPTESLVAISSSSEPSSSTLSSTSVIGAVGEVGLGLFLDAEVEGHTLLLELGDLLVDRQKGQVVLAYPHVELVGLLGHPPILSVDDLLMRIIQRRRGSSPCPATLAAGVCLFLGVPVHG